MILTHFIPSPQLNLYQQPLVYTFPCLFTGLPLKARFTPSVLSNTSDIRLPSNYEHKYRRHPLAQMRETEHSSEVHPLQMVSPTNKEVRHKARSRWAWGPSGCIFKMWTLIGTWHHRPTWKALCTHPKCSQCDLSGRRWSGLTMNSGALGTG